MSTQPIPFQSPSAGLEARLARIEAMLEQVSRQLEQVTPMSAMAVDIVDELAADAVARGVDPAERLRGLMRLMETMSEPSTVRTLQGILERVDRLEPLLEVVDQAPGLIAMGVDIFDEAVGNAIERGVDVQGAVRAATKGFVRLGEFILSEQFSNLLSSGMLDPEAVSLLGRIGRALADVAREDDAQAPGLIGLMRAGQQEDVRRALGFGVRFGGRFGQLLRKQLSR